MRVGEQRCALHVTRTVEHDHAHITLSGVFEHLDQHAALAVLAVFVGQGHGLRGDEIAVAGVALIGVERDGEAFFLRSFGPRGGARNSQ